MRRTAIRVLVGTGLAAGTAAAVVLTGPAPAGAGAARIPGWHTALQAAAAAEGTSAATAPGSSTTPPSADITGAQRLRIVTHPLRGNGVDTGPEGESGGDYFVFEERLTDSAGRAIGLDSARCMLMVRTFRCDATFFLDGRGTIEAIGSLRGNGNAFAVTGGTGDFRNVRGQARIVSESEDRTVFVFSLLP